MLRPPPPVRWEAEQPIADTDKTRTRIRPLPFVLTTLLILAALLVADGAYVAANMRSGLTLAARYLTEARASLSGGDVEGARRQAMAAEEAIEQARSSVDRPSFAVGSYLPVLNGDVRAVAALTEASRETTAAVLSATSAAAEIGLTPEGVWDSIYSNGEVDLGAVEAARPHVQAANASLLTASDLLAGELSPRVPMVQQAVADARSTIADGLDSSETARHLFSSLPSLLGGDGAKAYLLAFQALGEARATGGLVGLVGVLDAEAGVVRLREVAPVLEVFPTPVPAVDAPSWFRASYSRQQALTQVQQANVSPNFPVASEVLLEMYRATHGEELDGVVMMDAVALQDLLAATGPIQPTSFPTELNSGNAADVILRDSYLEFADEAGQNAFLGDVVQTFWDRVRDGAFDVVALGQSLDKTSSSGHFKVYTRGEAQSSLSALGVAGGYPIESENPQMVFHNNYGVNKVDYFLRRSVKTEVELTEDGNAEVSVTARVENLAPSEPSSPLIGTGDAVPPGENRMLLSFMLPPTAEQMRLGEDVPRPEPQLWLEDDLPVASTVLRVPAGEERTVTLSYFLPAAVDLQAERPTFELALLPQTVVTPDRYRLEIQPPASYRIGPASGGAAEGSLVLEGHLEGVTTARVVLTRGDQAVKAGNS